MSGTLRNALVLGLAASGEAAARLLLAEEVHVVVADQADTPKLRSMAAELEQAGARVLLGCDLPEHESFDLAVVSPGIRSDSRALAELRKADVPLLSELELGWRRARCRTLAVTGSNGKSTLTALCAEVFQAAGLKAEPAGNFGPPASRIVLEQPDLDWLILEVSSFQLETVSEFRPDIGVLLNVLPNHLDRHGALSVYRDLKLRLFKNMTPGDVAIVPEGMAEFFAGKAGSAHKTLFFGASAVADYRHMPGQILARARSGVEEHGFDLTGSYFDNDVLGLAAAAALAATESAGLSAAAFAGGLARFQPLPHRLQEAAKAAGIRFVNDSKATNVAALGAALRMIPPRIRLIAGGLGKDESFAPVLPLIRERVSGIYLIGKAAAAMKAAWDEAAPCVLCDNLENAVHAACADARAGETILLSPACASFDQFRSFEERGEKFAALARSLAATLPACRA